MNKVPSKYLPLVKEVQEIYTKHGSSITEVVEQAHGLNEYYKSDGNWMDFVFYYTGLSRIVTPDGTIVPLGSRTAGNEELAQKEVIEKYNLTLISDTTKNYERWIVYRQNL